jgi:hypothetical protein
VNLAVWSDQPAPVSRTHLFGDLSPLSGNEVEARGSQRRSSRRFFSKFSPKFFRRPRFSQNFRRNFFVAPRQLAVKAEHCRSACTFPRQSGCAAFPRWSVCDALPPRDIEVVVESALSLVVVVSALWNRRFRCRFPPLRFGFFRHWTFVFCGTSRRAALASAWASSTVLMRCHSFVGGARRTGK